MASGKRTVVVTGASTGIGRATARYLRERGFRVLAGVRNDSDARSLTSEGIEPLRIDVTDARSIEEASSTAGNDIDGLVNNAGISVAGPIEALSMDALRHQLDVNVVGTVAVTQAFLPRLRASRGRIINMSSISGRFAPPFLGAYAMSKFALEAFSDSLRRELMPFGVEVVSILPGAIDTPIWEKSIAAADERAAQASRDRLALYRGPIERMTTFARERARNATPAEAVARAVHQALTARRPRTRYLVGADARARARLARWLPDRWFDWLIARRLGLRPDA